MYGTVKCIIVYVCEPLLYKTTEGSLAGVLFLLEARLAGTEEIMLSARGGVY